MIKQSELIIAFKEEIGTTELFTGRKAEFDYFFRWLTGVKKEVHRSIALLARRKKGKTALVQRLYNMLFTLNDPMIIPIYYKVKEEDKSQLKLANEFYNTLLCQYAAFKTRDITLVKKIEPYSELKEVFKDDKVLMEDIEYMEMCLEEKDGDKAWAHAAYAGERISILKNERIIQIIDEFQYLDKYIYLIEDGIERHLPLCGTYHHVGASKIAPVIVTGSYVTWLLSIVRKMTGRYNKKHLYNLPLGEALEAIYTYAKVFNQPITEEVAAYIATVTEGDVYYIARMFETEYQHKDLTKIETIDKIILYETRTKRNEIGAIADMWFEYLYDAIEKVNDLNGKKIILYLAKQGKKEKTRKEIKEELGLEMTDKELEKKLNTFIEAEILSYGETRYRYAGLGDKFFEIMFRSMYQEEIEAIDLQTIEKDIKKELKSIRGKANFYKGMMTEYAVINKILMAIIKKQQLKELLYHHIEGYELTEVSTAIKKRISLDQSSFIEVDVYLESKQNKNANDFIIEVKNYETPIPKEHIERFIDNKNKIETMMEEKAKELEKDIEKDLEIKQEKENNKRIGYIFYSQKRLSNKMEEKLIQNNIMIMYGE